MLQVIVLATYLLNEVLYLLLTLLLRHFGYDRKLVWTLLSPQSPLLLWNDPQRSLWCQLWLLISFECDDMCKWLLAMDTMDGDIDMDQDWSDLSASDPKSFPYLCVLCSCDALDYLPFYHPNYFLALSFSFCIPLYLLSSLHCIKLLDLLPCGFSIHCHFPLFPTISLLICYLSPRHHFAGYEVVPLPHC